MPTTTTGLALFVVLLAPGFIFLKRRQRWSPRRPASVFQETAEVALASLTAISVALCVYSAARVVTPRRAPDIGRWLREGGDYFVGHYRSIVVWSACLLALACSLAFVAAELLSRRIESRQRPQANSLTRLVTRGRPPASGAARALPISDESRWWEMFRTEVAADEQVWAQCTLEDGTYLAGLVGSFSDGTTENADRDLVLVGPIDYRGPADDDVTVLRSGAVIVSARQLRYIIVCYLPLDADGTAS